MNAMTLPQLKDEIKNSFLVKPEAEILGIVWDVKGWMDNSLNDISNHSYQHQFWFIKTTKFNTQRKTKFPLNNKVANMKPSNR